MILIFVAGPYTAPTQKQVEANIKRCERLAMEVQALDCGAICMNSMGRDWDGETPTLDQVMASSKLALSRCDALIVAEGWQHSTGTKEEIVEADRLGLKVLYSIAGLEVYLDGIHQPA